MFVSGKTPYVFPENYNVFLRCWNRKCCDCFYV